jgi:hypothetical protein
MATAKTNYSWALANNSGIQNNASGDVFSLAGTDGMAGSSHGIQDGSGASNITKGDRIDVFTVCIDATNGYYQWFATAPVAGTWALY